MQIPLQITFRGLDHSDAVETKIREKIAKLEQLYDGIISCRVVVDVARKTSGSTHRVDEPFHIHVEMAIPGATLVVKRDPKDLKPNEDILVALKEAFTNLERQMKETLARQRGEVRVSAAQ